MVVYAIGCGIVVWERWKTCCMVLNAKQLLQKHQKIAYIQHPQHFIFEMEIKRVQFIHYA